MANSPKGVQLLICPKCGKRAYYGKLVTRRGKYGKVYGYRKYLHYAGMRGSITLIKLEQLLLRRLPKESVDEIIAEARGTAGAKRVEHYVPTDVDQSGAESTPLIPENEEPTHAQRHHRPAE